MESLLTGKFNGLLKSKQKEIDMTTYTGSCLCGSVTYKAEGEPRRVFECYCNWCQKITGGSARAYAVFELGSVEYTGGNVSEFVDTNTEHGFKMINRFCAKCASPIEMLVERVPDGQFVPLGTIDQRQQLIVNEGLWGQAALPHVAFKKGREVKKQGGDSDLI